MSVLTSNPVLADLASEIVAAYVGNNHVPPTELPALIATVHGALGGLGREPESDTLVQPFKPAVPIRRSVTDTHIISLEDGKPYKALKRHLRKLGLTPEAYRMKWGLPLDYPMTSPACSRARSALAKEIGLGVMRRKR